MTTTFTTMLGKIFAGFPGLRRLMVSNVAQTKQSTASHTDPSHMVEYNRHATPALVCGCKQAHCCCCCCLTLTLCTPQWDASLSGQDYTETNLLSVKHYIKQDSSHDPSPLQFYNAFKAKWGIGPNYQIASAMAGLYHLGIRVSVDPMYCRCL